MPTTIETLRNQTSKFFDLVTDTALQPILKSDLPFVGSIASAALNGLLGDLRTAIDGALATVADATTDEQLAINIAQKLNGVAPGIVTATASGDVVSITIADHETVTYGKALPSLDIGSDALGLHVSGATGINFGYDIKAMLAFDVGDKRLELLNADTDTVTLTVEASLQNLELDGDLGVLAIQAHDAYTPHEVSLTAGIDIAGGKINQIIATPLADAVDIDIDGSANVDLAIVAGGGASGVASIIPKIYTDLVANYVVSDYNPLTSDGSFGTPLIAFNNVEIDTGSLLRFLGGIFQPVFDGVFGSFPIKQLLNTLTTPLPVLSDAADAVGLLPTVDYVEDGKLNLLDLAGALAAAKGATQESIEAFSKAISLIQGLTALNHDINDPAGRIRLGDFVVAGGTASLAPLDAANGDLIDQALQDLTTALGMQDAPTGTPGLKGPASSLAELLDGTGFEIPLLTDSKAILSILTNGFGGDPYDLIRYHVPRLEFKAGFDYFFNIVGPFGVGFDGSFGAAIDFDVGYDTAGVTTGKFADGFYFTTDEGNFQVGDETLNHAPAATVDVEIGAKAGVNVGIAEAGVRGGLFAGLRAFFENADGDGKLRLIDVTHCTFDPIAGEFGIKVQAYVTIGFSPFDYTKRFDIVKVTLANFEYGCPPPNTDPDHGLAALGATSAKTLTLNTGMNRAQLRSINGHAGADGEESYVVSNAPGGALTVTAFGISEINGNPAAGPATDDAVAPTLVEANMGKFNDQVAFDEDVGVRAILYGEDGDDLLASGSANDRLYGNDGADRLLGRAGIDQLYGGAGSDVLEGGAGGDLLDGGTDSDHKDTDQVSYEFSSAGVKIVALGATGSFRGYGGDAEGDTLIGIEHLIGSHFDDELTGTKSGRNILEGLDGVDILQGGDVEDLLIGGGKADTLRGGLGNDTISYVSSAGQVQVDLAAGKGFGGDAEGDTFESIENVQGTFGDDFIAGNGAANRLDGWFGDDFIVGGKGKDTIEGGAGADFIVGGADGDLISGGGRYGSQERDTLSYLASTVGVTIDLSTTDATKTQDVVTRQTFGFVTLDAYSTIENLWGSTRADVLTGDAQDNVIWGFDGFDQIKGLAGNDTIAGGRSVDWIDGGDGRDLADYRASGAAVSVNLSSNSNKGGDAQGDTLTSIEDLRGSNYADTLTGNTRDNRIDAGLSRGSGVTGVDVVNGGNDALFGDVLVVDWSQGDTGKGFLGGFVANTPNGAGWFERQKADSSDRLDRIEFSNIERLEVIGTSKGDVVSGGAHADMISTGDGNDIVYAGLGYDRIYAGAGSDAVAVGTGADGLLSREGYTDFGDIRGGSGIDFLSLSLAASFADIVLAGRDGTTQYLGKNFVSDSGSAISEFEVLYGVYTGYGDDTLTQPGRWNNVFATSYGVDNIAAGLGQDIVDGGLDFRMGSEIDQVNPQATTLVALRDDFADVFANDGDYLEVDYRASTNGIFSEVGQVDTGFDITTSDGFRTIDVLTNNGYYQSGTDKVSFSNIERVRVYGSSAADGISGTDLTYGVNLREGPDQEFVAADSQRGDDVILGYGGNDFLVGGTGSDTLDGGIGNDALLGTRFDTGRSEPMNDRNEIDQLVGGTGRDTFIVGLGRSFYNDISTDDPLSARHFSSENRALVTDFVRSQDTILLAALTSGASGSRPPSAFYTTVERDGNTYIYLKDGLNTSDKADPTRNELIAELDGVTGFNLKASYVTYFTLDGRYLRGDGTETTAPVALSGASAPETHDALMALVNGAHHDAAPAPTTAVDAGRPGADAIAAADAAVDAPAPDWVIQNADPDALRTALFGNSSELVGGTMTLSGNSAGFGTFHGDPFGLGDGVILSTGRVIDVAGVNEVDGGRQAGKTVDLTFEEAGRITVGGVSSVLYRVDVSNLGFDLNSIRLNDSGSGEGGGVGRASGFDIDAVFLSHDFADGITTADEANAISRIDAFSYNVADTMFEQGNLRETAGDFEYTWGVKNGAVDFAWATLGTVDGRSQLNNGKSVTLGDGGSLGFNLNGPVQTDGPLYLYVAEAGTSGETITTGFTASENRLTAPSDLSTDLGLPGGEDDTVSMTYTFTPRTNTPVNQIEFDFVFFSEEFAEYALAGFNDTFKVSINGVNMAVLSDGSFASVDSLYSPVAGADSYNGIYGIAQRSSNGDYIYNPVEGGPAADQTRADGYSRTLHFVGALKPGELNELKIEVKDSGDGFLDSGILIKGGSFSVDTRGAFTIDRPTRPVHEGESGRSHYAIEVPAGSPFNERVTVVFTPSAEIDLGAGAGRAITRSLDGTTLSGDLAYTVVGDGKAGRDYFATIGVEIRGLDGTTSVAPVVIQVDDSVVSRSWTVGDADPANPRGWAAAWMHDGLTIQHSADGRTYSAVTLNDSSPDTLAGGDLYQGDLGVSGNPGFTTRLPQEIGRSEFLRFDFASRDVTAVSIDFERLETSDRAHVTFLDVRGNVVREVTGINSGTASVSDLSKVATMIVSSDAGGFLVDSVSVTENAVVRTPPFTAFGEDRLAYELPVSAPSDIIAPDYLIRFH